MDSNEETILSLFGIPFRVDSSVPPNEIWLVREAETQTLHVHEGPQMGQTVTAVIKPGQIFRVIDLNPSIAEPSEWKNLKRHEVAGS